MDSQTLQNLVISFSKNPTPECKYAIVKASMPLIRSVISKTTHSKKSLLTQKEDLESAGVAGIIEALNAYDPTKGIKFVTFAYYRMRGSIIDHLRKTDLLSRKNRQDYSLAQRIIEKKSQELFREPGEREVALEMDMTIDGYRKLLELAEGRTSASLNEEFSNDGYSYKFLDHEDGEFPDINLEKKELKKILERQINKLRERERIILSLYFYKGKTMREIGILLKLTEVRISQLVSEIVGKLRKSLVKQEAF